VGLGDRRSGDAWVGEIVGRETRKWRKCVDGGDPRSGDA
jgi:hypothetical protein